MGFRIATLGTLEVYNRLHHAEQHLTKALIFLRPYTPPKSPHPLLEGVAKITIAVPGHVDCSYTVIDEPTSSAYDDELGPSMHHNDVSYIFKFSFYRDSQQSIEHLMHILKLIDFPTAVLSTSEFCNRQYYTPQYLARALILLNSHKPEAFPRSLADGIAEITFQVPGVIDCKYTMINLPLPTAMLSDITTPAMHQKNFTGCVLGMMEFYHDEQQRSELNTTAFFQIRAMEPKLLPWSVGQKVTETNPWLYKPGSIFADHCHDRYWVPRYDTNTKGSRANQHVFSYYCLQYRRFEKSHSTSQLAMQLVQGYFSYEEWIILCSKIFDETQKNESVTGIESKSCVSLHPENC